MKYKISFLVLAFFYGCSHIKEDIKDIMEHNLSIPQNEMISYSWSSQLDSVRTPNILSLIFYITKEQCQSCYFTELVKYERSNYEELKKNGVRIMYIIATDKLNKKKLEDELINARIKGVAFLDTCNVFLESNPHIPEKELYHTFVCNNEGKILMVGNPFQNEKMEALFKKVIANEQRKHKTKPANKRNE